MLGASSKFFKVYSQAYTFFPLGGGVVWASGYRLGLTNDFGERLEEEDRFQAGGPSSVRGFEQGTLGPTDDIVDAPIGGAALVVVNQEIRFPLVWRLRGVGFYDVGNVFDDPSNVSFSDLRHSAGAGLRLELPFGLIRLDWARVLDPREGDRFARFIFSLGHAF
jgi:outer membrane protein assembly factor BamA